MYIFFFQRKDEEEEEEEEEKKKKRSPTTSARVKRPRVKSTNILLSKLSREQKIRHLSKISFFFLRENF